MHETELAIINMAETLKTVKRKLPVMCMESVLIDSTLSAWREEIEKAREVVRNDIPQR